ncbi:MAG: MarR family transcriptional regulator [Spirochaetales bacterium]|nr:MarR family transcriptional regulator [Spirochaetales bacterium]
MGRLTATPERSSYLLLRDMLRLLRLLQQETIFCNGITLTQFIVLDHVAEADGALELSALHEVLMVDSSTTTRLIAPLIGRGLLKREKSERDPRAARLHLTMAGWSVHEEFFSCLSSHLQPLSSALNREETRRGMKCLLASLGSCCSAGQCC